MAFDQCRDLIAQLQHVSALAVSSTAEAARLAAEEGDATHVAIVGADAAALYGLTHGMVTQSQYSQMVTVMILWAFVPTIIAQQLFAPRIVRDEEEEEVGVEDVAPKHVRVLPPEEATGGEVRLDPWEEELDAEADPEPEPTHPRRGY